jgi:hypothetical protein
MRRIRAECSDDQAARDGCSALFDSALQRSQLLVGDRGIYLKAMQQFFCVDVGLFTKPWPDERPRLLKRISGTPRYFKLCPAPLRRAIHPSERHGRAPLCLVKTVEPIALPEIMIRAQMRIAAVVGCCESLSARLRAAWSKFPCACATGATSPQAIMQPAGPGPSVQHRPAPRNRVVSDRPCHRNEEMQCQPERRREESTLTRGAHKPPAMDCHP